MRRRILGAVMASFMIAALAGCGSSDQSETTASGGRMGPGGGAAQVGSGSGSTTGETTVEAPTGDEATGEGNILDPNYNDGEPAEVIETDEALGNWTPAPGEQGYAPAPLPEPIQNGQPGGLPLDAPPAQGASAWGLYLATGTTPSDPAIAGASSAAEAKGYYPGVKAADCDAGAPEALGVPGDRIVAVLYFTSQANAQAFGAAYGGPVAGIAQVTANCQD